jgi:hypothetical protein
MADRKHRQAQIGSMVDIALIAPPVSAAGITRVAQQDRFETHGSTPPGWLGFAAYRTRAPSLYRQNLARLQRKC